MSFFILIVLQGIEAVRIFRAYRKEQLEELEIRISIIIILLQFHFLFSFWFLVVINFIFCYQVIRMGARCYGY